MKACEFDCGALDALVKYNEDQPRVPKGNPDGGQWTRDGGGASPASHDRSRGSDVAIVLPEGCKEEWVWALGYCSELLEMPNPPRALTGVIRIPGIARWVPSVSDAVEIASERCNDGIQRRHVCARENP
jgi:hypothetical protein